MAEAVATQVCPVCSECLEEPKLLPCAHLLCKKCVLATVEKTGEKPSGCPSCRHSILPEHQMGDIDLAVFVDSLPTDDVTWMKIQSQKLLSDTATCSVCDTDTDSKSEATAFCFQCEIKLCRNCAKYHRKFPFLSDHTVEELSTLTTETLAAKKCVSCNLHKDKAVEKYCSSHRELVCLLCVCSGHEDCDGVEDIELSAERERNDLAEQNKRLKQRETSLSDEIEMLDKQIREAEAKFARMRKEVISTCTDIIKCYEAQKHKLLDDIDQKEQEFLEEKLANKDQLEALKSDMAAHTISVDQVMSSAPGKALLATLGRLKSRLDDLETKKPVTHDEATVGEVYFDVKMVDRLKESADVTGEVRDSPHGQDKVELFKCLVCDTVTEGTFQFEVLAQNLSKTSGRSDSKPCIIRHVPWTIAVLPYCVPDKTHLGLFLQCDVPDTLRSFSCNVKRSLRILNTLPDRKPLEKEGEKKYSKDGGLGWGRHAFIPMAKLMDPSNGYLKDGKVTFGAHVAPDVPEWTWTLQ